MAAVKEALAEDRAEDLAVLAEEVRAAEEAEEVGKNMDFKISVFLNQLEKKFIDYLFRFISWNWFLVPFLTILSLTAFFFDKNNGARVFLSVALAVAFHFFFDQFVLKNLMPKFFPARRRPYLAYPEKIKPFGKKSQDSSFPSNHMAGTLSVLTVFLNYYSSWNISIVVFAFLMGLARIRNGMHYPSDVLAGAVLGICWAMLGIYLVNNYFGVIV